MFRGAAPAVITESHPRETALDTLTPTKAASILIHRNALTALAAVPFAYGKCTASAPDVDSSAGSGVWKDNCTQRVRLAPARTQAAGCIRQPSEAGANRLPMRQGRCFAPHERCNGLADHSPQFAAVRVWG